MQANVQSLQSLQGSTTSKTFRTFFRPWGYVCRKANARDFRAELQVNGLYEVPLGSGEGSCKSNHDAINRLHSTSFNTRLISIKASALTAFASFVKSP
ncbi:hypothetical protein BV898_02803 [Hypsibius exemplaris]|uniref:Uncharacterized protein n=1 Tax=Hypsibius exemplaris TaxID=2072580 RepID=A0A1W0X750_HYPEX|nr:hypothetical protein BV898_02803 [Hypsibius exemplaris]